MDGRVLIGCAEYVDLPGWGLRRLKAKVDSGARTSALHVCNLRRLKGGLRVRFEVVPEVGGTGGVKVVAPIRRRARVRSSTGQTEMRYFVEVTLVLGPLVRCIEVGLADRTPMRYRMLLGRQALAGIALVDPGRRYVVSRRKSRRRKPRGKKEARG